MYLQTHLQARKLKKGAVDWDNNNNNKNIKVRLMSPQLID